MKKISKILLLTVVMLCFAFTTPSNSEATELKQPKVIEKVTEIDEALYCKREIRSPDGSSETRSCWFCKCSELQ